MLRFQSGPGDDCPISRIRLLHVIHRDCHSFIKSRLGDIGISSAQFPMILIIYHNDGINQGRAAESLGLDKGTVARGMMRLEKAGLIRRERDAGDRRNYILRLTAAGKDAMERLMVIRSELETALVKGMSDEEKRELERLLQMMHENVTEGQ